MIAAVRDCPGGVRAFYKTLGLYKFPVHGRGLCPKGLALNKTCPRVLRLAITLSMGQKMKSSCTRGGGGVRTCSSIGGVRLFNGIAH